MRRDLARFEDTCRPLLGDRLDAWLELYDTHERVLTVEASCVRAGSFGLGNVFPDFIAWFVVGILERRAVYVRWTDCADEDDDATRSSHPKREAGFAPGGCAPVPCRGRANPGQYFQLPGGRDWILTPASRARVDLAVNRGPEGQPIPSPSSHLVPGNRTGPALVLDAPGDFPGGPSDLFGDDLVRVDTALAGDERWVEIRVSSGHGLVPHPTGAAVSDATVREWADALIAGPYRRLAALVGVDVSQSTRGDATKRAPEGDRALTFALNEGRHGVHVRGCVQHAVMRPTPRLQRALVPFLREFDSGNALTALHVRTMFADRVGDEGERADRVPAECAEGDEGDADANVYAFAKRLIADASSGELSLAKIRHGPFAWRWKALDRMLAAGGYARRNDDPASARCPAVAERPFLFGEPEDAGLAPFVTCAGRAAELAAEERGDRDGWRLYVATDAPYLRRLVDEHPDLEGRGVGCPPGAGACEGRHTAHRIRDEDEREGDGDGDGEGVDAYAQTFVDAWILGAADQTLPATTSTFSWMAHRGFGLRGRPQMMDDEREGYPLAREAFTAKHLPLCEALKLDDANDADCACVYAAVWGREIRRTDDSAPEETRVFDGRDGDEADGADGADGDASP